MKKIIGLREAQLDYKWAVASNKVIDFYFCPETGKLICEGCDSVESAGLRVDYNRSRGFVWLDVYDLGHYYGTRGMFALIKKHIGQKWTEYAEKKLGDRL